MDSGKRPNIVLFMMDQLRLDALGCYGNDIIQTPNIDKIANNGVKFTNFISPNPLCMPVRASLITGRFPSCHGVKSNGIPLSQDEVTFVTKLASGGYYTGIIGKLHLVPKSIRRAYLPHPGYGFNLIELAEGEFNPTIGLGHFDNKNLVTNCPDEYSIWLKKTRPDIYYKLLQEPYDYRPGISPCPEEVHQATWITNQSIKFLNRHYQDSMPFYLNISFFDPHPKFNPPTKYADLYDFNKINAPIYSAGSDHKKPIYSDTETLTEMIKKQVRDANDWKRLRVAYYGLISFIDKQIGRVINQIKKLNLIDNTLIIFCSDHGEMLGDHGLIEKGPYAHYDQVLRVPLIISWPKQIPSGKTITELVQHVDIAPTILEAADITPSPSSGMQGVSLFPIIKGVATGYDCTLTQDFGMLSQWKKAKLLTIRTDRYRFTHHLNQPYGELYDLKKDPHEIENFYNDSSYHALRSDLQVMLLDKCIETFDPLPSFTADY